MVEKDVSEARHEQLEQTTARLGGEPPVRRQTKSVRDIPPLSATLKRSIKEHNQRVTEVIRRNHAKVLLTAAPAQQLEPAPTSELTDAETKENLILNKLLEGESAKIEIDCHIILLNRDKSGDPNTSCYSMSINGFALKTPLVYYSDTKYYMLDIPDELRSGAAGVIWDRNLYSALHKIISGVRLQTCELLARGTAEFFIAGNAVHVEKTGGDVEGVVIFAVSVNDVILEQRLIYLHSGNPAHFVFQAPDSFDKTSGVILIVWADDPYNALLKIIGHGAFPAYLDSLRTERARKAADAEEVTRKIIEETQRFRAVLIRKYLQLTYIDEYETVVNDGFEKEARRFVQRRLSRIDAQWVERAVVIIDALVSEWAGQAGERSNDIKFDASMSPTDYERYCADRFAAGGWKVRLTKNTGDQGADIICEGAGRRLVVQCKLYSGSVGNAAVQEVIAAREFEYADSAAVVSNAPYTKLARQLAAAARVHLLHHDEICNMNPNST